MRVIFDNDGSTDDVIALIYLLTHPNVIVELITLASTGEVHGPEGSQNLADLCYMLGKPNIPIAYGSEKPCDGSGKPFPNFIRELIDALFKDKNVPQNPKPNISDSAVEAIRKVVESSDEKITIVATGPLTNIAQFLEKYPQLKDKIEKVVIMGGAVDTHGNIKALDPDSNNTVAEWNIYADPKAAEIVFASGVPVTLVPLDATNQVPMTKEFYDAFSAQIQPELQLIHKLLKVFVDKFGLDFFLKEFYLWDPLAAMIAVEPQLAQTEKIAIQMDLDTAQTKRVEVGSNHSSVINVAMKIPHAELILKRLFDELKTNLINHQKKTTPSYLFQMPQIISNAFQQISNFNSRFNFRN